MTLESGFKKWPWNLHRKIALEKWCQKMALEIVSEAASENDSRK
jgi:hypothetical protein